MTGQQHSIHPPPMQPNVPPAGVVSYANPYLQSVSSAGFYPSQQFLQPGVMATTGLGTQVKINLFYIFMENTWMPFELQCFLLILCIQKDCDYLNMDTKPLICVRHISQRILHVHVQIEVTEFLQNIIFF